MFCHYLEDFILRFAFGDEITFLFPGNFRTAK